MIWSPSKRFSSATQITAAGEKKQTVVHICTYIPLLMTCNRAFDVWCFCLQGCLLQRRRATFEAADSAHGGEHRRLHFNVPHSSLVRFPQILQFFFVREGAERSIQAPLACRDPQFVTSGRASATKTWAWRACVGTNLRRSRGCTWCFRSPWGSCRAQRSTAGARWRRPRPAPCSW